MSKKSANSLAALSYYTSEDSDDGDETVTGTRAFSDKYSGQFNTSWTKCFDKKTGHPYYWNTDSREVTWDVPAEYSKYLNCIKQTGRLHDNKPKYWVACQTDDRDQVYYVNKISRIVSWDVPEGYDVKKSLKSIENEIKSVERSVKTGEFDEECEDDNIIIGRTIDPIKPQTHTRPDRQYVEDENEKQVEEKQNDIDSHRRTTDSNHSRSEAYHSRSDHKRENYPHRGTSHRPEIHEVKPVNANLLPRLPALRGQKENDPLSLPAKCLDKKLVPHYDDDSNSDDSNHGEEEPVSTLFPISLSAAEQLDALFNKDKPTEVTNSNNKTQNENNSRTKPSDLPIIEENNFDTKLFKRKRRIEVIKKRKPNNGNQFVVDPPENDASNDEPIEILEDIPNSDGENSLSNPQTQAKANPYGNFVKGSDDVLEITRKESVQVDTNIKRKDCRQIQQHKKNEINNVGRLMRNKLKFLSESTAPATSAQIMYIQFETLMEAYDSQNLNVNYLLKWIRETKATLENLERDAVPSGWKCEWDRSSSRYVYHNLETDTKQYEYPTEENDENSKDDLPHDEMDISTTPPPPIECDVNDVEIDVDSSTVLSTPVEPKLRGELSPPPPPIISTLSPKSHDVVQQNFSFGSEMASFYSEIGSLEDEQNPPLSNDSVANVASTGPNLNTLRAALANPSDKPLFPIIDHAAVEAAADTKKKFKKKKVVGLSSKMNDISGMVAKWQKVQRDYNS